MILNRLLRNQEYISYFIVLLFGLIIFFLIQDPYESFFINYDQEFWNTYNSLLIYSGLEQEKYDEPGHVSYLLFAVYLKIINFFQIIEVPTIYKINEIENVSKKIESLIFHSRFRPRDVSRWIRNAIFMQIHAFRHQIHNSEPQICQISYPQHPPRSPKGSP